jgi:hypothetical protein
MTLSYHESILHLVENSSPEQLKSSYLRLLREYKCHLVGSCHSVNIHALNGDKNAMHDYLKIANSMVRVRKAIEKCNEAYKKTSSTKAFLISPDGYEELKDVPEEITDILSLIIPEIFDSELNSNRSNTEASELCNVCIPNQLKLMHPYIEKLGNDEQSKEIKKLEEELKVNLGLEIPKPKGQPIKIE